MATVCDLCGKGERSRGPGQTLFHVCWASAMSGGFSVHFEPVSPDRYRRTDRAICGVCLDKLGILDMLAAERLEEADRLRRLAEREGGVVHVTPRRIDGSRRTRLLGAGK